MPPGESANCQSWSSCRFFFPPWGGAFTRGDSCRWLLREGSHLMTHPSEKWIGFEESDCHLPHGWMFPYIPGRNQHVKLIVSILGHCKEKFIGWFLPVVQVLKMLWGDNLIWEGMRGEQRKVRRSNISEPFVNITEVEYHPSPLRVLLSITVSRFLSLNRSTRQQLWDILTGFTQLYLCMGRSSMCSRLYINI